MKSLVTQSQRTTVPDYRLASNSPTDKISWHFSHWSFIFRHPVELWRISLHTVRSSSPSGHMKGERSRLRHVALWKGAHPILLQASAQPPLSGQDAAWFAYRHGTSLWHPEDVRMAPQQVWPALPPSPSEEISPTTVPQLCAFWPHTLLHSPWLMVLPN